MRTLIFLHRWLGIPLCLLFALWFATGIVMHFVPFPAWTEGERIAGLAVLDLSQVAHGPAEAILASRLDGVRRVRLWQRSDGPVYRVLAVSGTATVHAADLSRAEVGTGALSLKIAIENARLHGLDTADASVAGLAEYDQWTVPNGFDRHRPLYRIALNDEAGTELYVSSRTGEVVLDTTRRERAWNYVGSVVHWIYPTILRRYWMAWNVTVWWLSLIAVIAALSGAMAGVLHFKMVQNRLVSPYRRWHAWHHWLGSVCAVFVITWIVSGCLSMDHGRLFPDGGLGESEADRITGKPAWSELTPAVLASVSPNTREIEWFAFGGRIYQRERTGADAQQLFPADSGHTGAPRAFLQTGEVNAALSRAIDGCTNTTIVKPDDAYPVASVIADAPVYRAACGGAWYHIDGASGANLERMDASRRAYRWLYRALHTFDFPFLMARPNLRTTVVVVLCVLGLAFSVTGIVIAWRRLRIQFR